MEDKLLTKTWKAIEESIAKEFTTIPEIRLRVSPPRPYMGRFDAGKATWTVGVQENETYSRTRTVRVAVDPKTGDFSYPKDKIQSIIKDCEEIVARSKAYKARLFAASDRIPNDLPSWVDVKVLSVESYEITVRHVNEEKMLKLVKAIKEALV